MVSSPCQECAVEADRQLCRAAASDLQRQLDGVRMELRSVTAERDLLTRSMHRLRNELQREEGK